MSNDEIVMGILEGLRNNWLTMQQAHDKMVEHFTVGEIHRVRKDPMGYAIMAGRVRLYIYQVNAGSVYAGVQGMEPTLRQILTDDNGEEYIRHGEEIVHLWDFHMHNVIYPAQK